MPLDRALDRFATQHARSETPPEAMASSHTPRGPRVRDVGTMVAHINTARITEGRPLRKPDFGVEDPSWVQPSGGWGCAHCDLCHEHAA